MPDRKQLIDALNVDLAQELAAIIQYFWHYVMASGLESTGTRATFRRFSITEMHHAEMLAERLNFLGGVPTVTPLPIAVGGDLTRMIQDDLAAERRAIELYKEHIRLAEQVGDPGTRQMLEQILNDEYEHASEWEHALGLV